MASFFESLDKEVVAAWNVNNLDELHKALVDASELAEIEGHSADTVYPNKLRVTLVRETLTDGSHVMNVYFFDGAPT